MPPLALALVICAALMHALWNIAAKKAGEALPAGHADNDAFMLMNAALIGVLWAPVGLWFAWHEVPRWGWTEWAFVGATTVVHLVYYRTLLRGYREADLTVVYPVARGSGPLITVVVAVALLGERPSAVGTAGVLAVCGGVFVLAGGPRLLRPPADAAAAARLRAGLRWGAMTGALIATYTVIDGYAVKVLAVGPIVLDWMTNVGRGLLLAPGQWRTAGSREAFMRAWRVQWRHALVVAVGAPVGYVMVLYAMTMAPLSLVAPARELSLLFAALLGGRLLGEGDRALRLAGAALIGGGVFLLGSA